MKKSQIIVNKNSSLMVVDTQVIDENGKVIDTPRVASICRCGASNHRLLCDGTHVEIGFDGTRTELLEEKIEYYKGREITIVYNRHLCMGAGFCGELEAVFGTSETPKYEPDAAPAQDIIDVISRCPSGALSYIKDSRHINEWFIHPVVKAEKCGPLHCQGGVDIIDDQDTDILLSTTDHYTLCRCGCSCKKPLCDGSHKVK